MIYMIYDLLIVLNICILSKRIHIGNIILYYSKSSIGCEKLESSSEFLTVEHL